MTEIPWMAYAWREYGVREIAGWRHSPRILAYFRQLQRRAYDGDETPWCAAFLGSCLERAGIASTRSLRARSYLEWGRAIEAPVPGCVVVLSRGRDPRAGHVGFFVVESDDRLWLLGGNQNDEVNVSGYAPSRVLGYRWPDGAPSFGALSDALFRKALAHVLAMEGGWSNDPADPGGATNKGITIATLAAHRGVTLNSDTRPALMAALRRIDDGELEEIYHKRYWQPSRAPYLPAALAFMHFDAAVNQGVGGARRMLQEALGVTVDGAIGPETLTAAWRRPLVETLAKFAEVRRRKYRRLRHFHRFGRGWLRRVEETFAAARRLAVRDGADVGLNQKEGKRRADRDSFESQAGKEKKDMPGQPKWWGKSITIWGALITALATLLPLIAPLFGVEITAAMVEEFGDRITQLLQILGGLVGTVMTIYGRLRATAPLERRQFEVKL